jgi:hypothetical protein
MERYLRHQFLSDMLVLLKYMESKTTKMEVACSGIVFTPSST